MALNGMINARDMDGSEQKLAVLTSKVKGREVTLRALRDQP